jgi:predicted dienelactone hydrolase
MRTMQRYFVLPLALVWAGLAHATVGMMEIPRAIGEGPLTVFYPTSAQAQTVQRGAFTLDVALDAPPSSGNGRLVVISHGSPASPWVYTDVARALVEQGFVVAMPEHYADNYKDDSEPGPPSWKRRPQEVSQAIDVLAADTRFAALHPLQRVGMYGMSAGGHTALTLAGGRWSAGQLRTHCEANFLQDFQACVGPSIRLTGGWLDGIKTSLAQWIVRSKPADPTWHSHTDPRIVAVVAGVPFAADFDPDSLAQPKVAVGLVSARQDQWLKPPFHSDAIARACKTCEVLADLPQGGHGALLSPLPPGRSGVVADLTADPPGFDRATEVPALHQKIVAFFVRHLLQSESK